MNAKLYWRFAGVAGRFLLTALLITLPGQSVFAQEKGTPTVGAQTNRPPVKTAKAANAQGGEAKKSPEPSSLVKGQEAQNERNESSVGQERPSGDGSHEGIKVHGHWTIEVRGTDGSLVRHVEFENSLDAGFTTGGQVISVYPGGAAYLSAVLTGQWAAPGVNSSSTWVIALVGPAGLTNFYNTDPNGPCAVGFDACLITSGTTCVTVAGTSCNLSIATLGTTPAFTGIRLSGSVAATQNGQVVTVATLVGSVSCVVTSTSCLPPSATNASFTSSTNFPGAPISVLAGQVIAVTVTISFS
jgi:hypothetical protein